MSDSQNMTVKYDLRRIVAQDLGDPPIRRGHLHLYKCPFHHDDKGYSLRVWHDGYRCAGQCGVSGDLVTWLVQYRRLSVEDAQACFTDSRLPPSHMPPPYAWQTVAREVVAVAEDRLWSSEGEHALTYLLERGLTTATIRQARLGVIAGDTHQWRKIAGLRVPCGIVLPWFASDALWAIKVHRAFGVQQHVWVAGGGVEGLYNADSLHDKAIPLLCDSEFDALLIGQEAGDLVAPVLWRTLSDHWRDRLSAYPTLLVACTRNRTPRRLSRFRALRLPHGRDITDFYLNGGDLYGWIEEGLRNVDAEAIFHVR